MGNLLSVIAFFLACVECYLVGLVVLKDTSVDIGQRDCGQVACAELFVLQSVCVINQSSLVSAPEVRVSGEDARALFLLPPKW
jgi:hypothetical protein